MKYQYRYEEQWERCKRLRKKIDSFADATDENFEDAIDAFTSFFIHCNHLRDWLEKSGCPKPEIDQYVKSNTWLSLCKDIANKQKHQEISRYKPKNNFFDWGLGVSTPITRYYDYFVYKTMRFGINVLDFGTSVDVITVADGSMEAWSKFIKNASARGTFDLISEKG